MISPLTTTQTLKPRKKPGQSRSANTVSTILEAAARILEERGLEGYTTNAIAECAGVSVGSLYQYFPNKDAITRALIERETTLMVAGLATDPAPESGRAGITRLIEVAVANQLRRPTLARLLDLEEDRLPPDAQVQALAGDMFQVLQRCLSSDDFSAAAERPETGADVVAIIRGMVDSAGRRGEADIPALSARVKWAVFGYLKMSSAPA